MVQCETMTHTGEPLSFTLCACTPSPDPPSTMCARLHASHKARGLGTLLPGKVNQQKLELHFTHEAQFQLAPGSGSAEVYITGFTEVEFEERTAPTDKRMAASMEEEADDLAPSQLAKRLRALGEHVESGESDSEEEEGTAQAIEQQALELAKREAVKQVGKAAKKYRGTDAERRDLLKNYAKTKGNWDLLLQFQPSASDEDLPRLQKLVKQAIKEGHAQKYSKSERAERKAELEAAMEEEELGSESEDESDSDSEDGESAAALGRFIEEDSDEGDDSSGDEDPQADAISKAALELAKREAVKQVGKAAKKYRGTDAERRDLLKNYAKTKGNWDLLLQFQPSASDEDLPRLQKLVKQAIKEGHAQKYSKSERAERKAELEAAMEEEELGSESEDESDSDSEAEDGNEDGFFVGGVEEEVSEDDSDSEE